MSKEAFSITQSFWRLVDDLRVKYLFLTPEKIAKAIVSYFCDIPMRDVVVAENIAQAHEFWSDKVHGCISASCTKGQTTVDVSSGSYKLKSGVEYDNLLVKNIPLINPLVQIHCDFFADGIDDRNNADIAIMWIDDLNYATHIGLHKKLPFNLIAAASPQNPMAKFYGCPTERIWDIIRRPHGQRMNALINIIEWFCSELAKGILACGFEVDSTSECCYRILHDEKHLTCGHIQE